MTRFPRQINPWAQRGAALVISLVLLITLTLLALSSANIGTLEERMASNFSQTNISFQRAENLLREVEVRVKDLSRGGTGGLGRIDAFSTVQDDLESAGLDPDLKRSNCTLLNGFEDGSVTIDELPWRKRDQIEGIDGSGHSLGSFEEFAVVELSGASENGEVFGSACRPMQSEDAGNPGQSAVYYTVLARAPADDVDGSGNPLTQAAVQSIFFWP
jgi:Tfp pilus assembly protein PilX